MSYLNVLIFVTLFSVSAALVCNRSAILVTEGTPNPSRMSANTNAFETIACENDVPDKTNYCFAGQFWFKNDKNAVESLFLTDCASNVKYVIEKMIPEYHNKVNIDCTTDLPIGKNATGISYAYDCCSNKNCDIPAFKDITNGATVQNYGIIFSLFSLMTLFLMRFL